MILTGKVRRECNTKNVEKCGRIILPVTEKEGIVTWNITVSRRMKNLCYRGIDNHENHLIIVGDKKSCMPLHHHLMRWGAAAWNGWWSSIRIELWKVVIGVLRIGEEVQLKLWVVDMTVLRNTIVDGYRKRTMTVYNGSYKTVWKEVTDEGTEGRIQNKWGYF